MTLSVMNYGGRVISLRVPDRYGVPSNVVLGYVSPEDYVTDPYYLGAVIGPVANRISSACFILDGKAYHMFSSEGNLILNIAELSDDYTSHTGRICPCGPGRP